MRSVHLSSEEVASYIDGRRWAAGRRRIAEHLASCDDCFELYSETLHSLSDTAGVVVQAPRRERTVARWVPAATAAILAVALGVGAYRALVGRPEIEVAELVETLQVSDGLVENVWTGETLLGDDEGVDVDRDAVSFLLGAHMLGFQATVEADDPDAACEASGRVLSVMVQGDYLDAAVQAFREARRSLRGGGSVSRFAHLVEETSPMIEKVLPRAQLDFGEWTQAGRIAALSRSTTFFEQRTNRRFLAWLLKQDEGTVDRDVMAKLRRIDEIWRDGPPAETFPELAGEFTAILELYEARARVEPSFS